MTSTRDQIIGATCQLMENQGLHATGLNQIVKESGAPKGSLYHYFPEGKDAIAEAAIERSGQMLAEHIRAALASTPDTAEAVRLFVEGIAYHVEASEYRTGGPLVATAMETAANERLNLACRAAYTLVQQAFQDHLVAGGFAKQRAAELAQFITAAIEGGTILCRVYHTGDPLRMAARQLGQLLRAAQGA